jgi:hypothetical protein
MSLQRLENVENLQHRPGSEDWSSDIDLEGLEWEYGFWHPFGPHSKEAPADIIDLKRRETEDNGWTLWSFQYRTPETLAAWCRQLSRARGPVLAFCSMGGSARDPADRPETRNTTSDCRHYRFIGCEQWHPVPHLIRVPHTFKHNQTIVSAFVVRAVHHPVKISRRPTVEWFTQKQGGWSEDKLPTRPEYLIRRGGSFTMPGVRAILELKPPYLAIVKR